MSTENDTLEGIANEIHARGMADVSKLREAIAAEHSEHPSIATMLDVVSAALAVAATLATDAAHLSREAQNDARDLAMNYVERLTHAALAELA